VRARRSCLLGAAACALALAGAERAGAESVFGLNLVGERFDVGDARVIALGGYVQVIDDSLGVLQVNPATAAWSKRVTFGVSGYFTSHVNRTEDLERRANATKLSMFSFAFPVYRKRVSMSLGYRGRYDPDGEFSVEHTTPQGDLYADVYERSGGLWSVPFTIAVDTGRFAKIGAYYSLERGRIEDTWIVNFADASSQDAVSSQERTLSGNGFGVGVSLRPMSWISLAATYESGIDYDVDVARRNTNSTADTAFTETAELPERWVVSALWRVARGVNVYGGVSVSDFTKFRGLDFPTSRLAREEVAALGVEYRLGGTPLRASARYEKLPYTLPDGEEITRMAFAIGSGLILRGGRGKLDVALQFGETGSVDTNGFSDRAVRFVVSIAGSEEWKTKREDR
jgi:hypothetical protein